jgi:hypothetical protein
MIDWRWDVNRLQRERVRGKGKAISDKKEGYVIVNFPQLLNSQLFCLRRCSAVLKIMSHYRFLFTLIFNGVKRETGKPPSAQIRSGYGAANDTHPHDTVACRNLDGG